MSEPAERRHGTLLEQHAQTVIGVVIIGLIGWVGATVSGTAQEVVRLQVQYEQVTQTLQEVKEQLRGASDDRYRASDARRDFATVHKRVDDHEKRINQIEKEHAGYKQ